MQTGGEKVSARTFNVFKGLVGVCVHMKGSVRVCVCVQRIMSAVNDLPAPARRQIERLYIHRGLFDLN